MERMSGSPSATPAQSDWTKPLRNAGRLAVGRGVQAVCSLIYLAVAARALGPTDFGALVLIHALALGIAEFSSFGSKEMLVRFGSMAIAEEDPARLRRLVWYGVSLDLLGAVCAWIFMAVAANWAFTRFELPASLHGLTLIYWFAAVAVMSLSQTATGILRLFDRFQLIAYQSTVEPVVRLVTALLVYQLQGGLYGFLLAWFGALLAGRLTLIVIARHALRQHPFPAAPRPTLREIVHPEPGIWRFVLWVQWTTTIGMVNTQLPLLAIGTAMTTRAAGLFKIAQQITALLERANSKLIVPSLYTELARLSAADANAERRHLVLKLTGWMLAVSTGIFLLLLALGRPLIGLIAGPDFAGAYSVMLWLAAAGAISTLSVTLEPLLMAAGRMRMIAVAGTLPLFIYVPMIFGVIGPGGLNGVGMATLIYAVLNGAILAVGARHSLRRDPARPAAPSDGAVSTRPQ